MSTLRITDDLDAMLEVLPPHVRDPLRERPDNFELLEVVLDLGRLPEAWDSRPTIRTSGTWSTR